MTLDDFVGWNVAFIFLSPSCRPCVDKIPDLTAYYPVARAQGVEMVIVNVDHHITGAEFAEDHAITMPVLTAPQLSNPFANDYDAWSTPAFCLVDDSGRIRGSGHLDTRYWQAQLALLYEYPADSFSRSDSAQVSQLSSTF